MDNPTYGSVTIGRETIGQLTVTRHTDGTYELDWCPPAGPCVVVNAVQWAALCRLIRRNRLTMPAQVTDQHHGHHQAQCRIHAGNDGQGHAHQSRRPGSAHAGP